ncbi:hypothetical protein HMPREF1578_01279 [Gardnerella pickettii JCP8017B]|nr:hypothetical protein HMPREF1578_01279 [Gardnerella pickettii JCP8017B]
MRLIRANAVGITSSASFSAFCCSTRRFEQQNRESCSVFVSKIRRVAVQTHYKK